MTEPYERYTKELLHLSTYRANWMPNAPLRLGDVGVLDGRLFDRRTSLSELGVEVQQRRGRPLDLFYASERDTDLSFAADLSAAPATPAAIKAEVKFGSEGAFVFAAAGCVETQIDDLDALTRELVALRDLEQRWLPDWVLVDVVVRSDRTTVLVAESANASMTLSLEGPSVGEPSLVPDGGISVTKQSGKVFHVVGVRSITPLYRVRRFKRTFLDWLGGRQSEEMARAAGPLDVRAEDVFEEMHDL